MNKQWKRIALSGTSHRTRREFIFTNISLKLLEREKNIIKLHDDDLNIDLISSFVYYQL